MKIKEEIEMFKEQLVAEMRNVFNTDEQIILNTVLKNNNVKKEAVIIKKDGINISPNFYIEHLYKQYKSGVSLEKLVDNIKAIYKNSSENINLKNIDMSIESCKNKIFYKLISLEKNKETIENLPHIPLMNLAVSFRVLVSQDESGVSSVAVTKDLKKTWGISLKELYSHAHRNTCRLFPPVVSRITDVIGSLMGMEAEKGEEDVLMPYVITNTKGINGATAIMYPGLLDKVAEKMHESFYLIPSSIHEMIVVPKNNNMTGEYLKDMVFSINKKCLDMEEYLSDDIYIYDIVNKKLEICIS